MKNNALSGIHRLALICIVTLIVTVDQWLKGVVENCAEGDVLFRFPPLFEIVHTQNHGAAFSMLTGERPLILIITTCMILFLAAVMLLHRRITIVARWSIAFLLGGGIGNWLDRMTFGGVTDYIRTLFIRFPVFNLADVCITLSSAVLFVLVVLGQLELTSEEAHGRTN